MRLAVLFDNFGPYHRARLQAASAEVELVAVQAAKQSAEYAWQAADQAAAFRVVTLFDSRTSRQVTASELSARISSCLAQVKPEVVAIPGWSSPAAFAALRWGLLNRVPVVAMSESTCWDEPRVAWKEWIKRQLVGCFSSALVGGRPHADYLAQLGLPRERIFLGYDAVDNEYFAQGAEEARRRRAEGGRKHTSPGVPPPSPLSGEGQSPEKYFLASARFIEKKNLPRLLQAYAEYRAKREAQGAKGEPWHLVLLGDGELRPALTTLRSALGLQHTVLLPGFKQYPELPAYYGCASAFIHASTTEQWGLVVNEAMASGLPVLVSKRCGCATDLVQDGVNGFTFDPYNVEQLAQLMFQISAMDASSPPRTGRGIQGEVSSSEFQPSTLNSGQLSTMGSASARIIASWGVERFASGLKAAAEKALAVGPVKPTWIQRAILAGLLAR